MFDKYTYLISGLKRLRKRKMKIPEQWLNSDIANYDRDLNLAMRLTADAVEPHLCQKPIFVSITQPMNEADDIQNITIQNIQIRTLWQRVQVYSKNRSFKPEMNHIDLSKPLGGKGGITFTDIIHITQDSRNKIAFVITEKNSSYHPRAMY